MATNCRRKPRYGREDKLLKLLNKIPDKKTREDILHIVHNAIIEHPNAYIIILDKNGTFLFENKSFHGVPLNEVIGSSHLSNFDGRVNHKDTKLMDTIFKKALKGETGNAEGELADGRKVAGSFIPVKKNGKVCYVVIIVYEITYQKEIEKLKKTKQLYEKQIKDVVVTRVRVPSGICEYISPSFKNVFGWEAKEGMDARSLFLSKLHPDFRDEMAEKWTKLLNGDVPSAIIYQAKTKTKGYRWFYEAYSGVYDEKGKLVGIDCVIQDITEQKELEEKFKDLQEKFNRILKEGKIALFTIRYNEKDKDSIIGTSIIFTDSIKNITGYDAKDFHDDPELWMKIIYAEDFNAMIDRYASQLRKGNKIDLTFRCIRKDGFICKIKTWGKIFRDKEGKPICVEGIAIDITDKDVYDKLLNHFAKKLAENESEVSLELFYIQ
ncbi:MAG: PAS domain S-box protein [Thermoplasmata archaeon]|nr:MAG: PAS domain S-box protein [Thermoplasmata archaeon]